MYYHIPIITISYSIKTSNIFWVPVSISLCMNFQGCCPFPRLGPHCCLSCIIILRIVPKFLVQWLYHFSYIPAVYVKFRAHEVLPCCISYVRWRFFVICSDSPLFWVSLLSCYEFSSTLSVQCPLCPDQIRVGPPLRHISTTYWLPMDITLHSWVVHLLTLTLHVVRNSYIYHGLGLHYVLSHSYFC